MEEVGEVWIQQWRRSVVPMVVPGHDGEGRADGAVLRHFNMEEERGTDVEAHAEDMEEGARWRVHGGGGRGGGAGASGCVTRK
jgi:hypothetical protein